MILIPIFLVLVCFLYLNQKIDKINKQDVEPKVYDVNKEDSYRGTTLFSRLYGKK